MGSKGKISIKKRSAGVLGKKQNSQKDKVVSDTEDSSNSDQNDSQSESDDVEMNENDEVNLSDVSSDDMEADDEEDVAKENDDDEEGEEDDSFPMKKKSKNSKHDDGSTDFSGAISAILGSHLKAYDRKDPIMARNKRVLKQTEQDKLEWKARKALAAERKKILNKTRTKDIIPVVGIEDEISGEEIRKILEKEAKLRKIAQRGAVKLFNAILSSQVKTEKEVTSTLANVKNPTERKQLITEVSKETFLDLVKEAGNE